MFIWLYFWLKFPRIVRVTEWLIVAVLILLLAMMATIPVQQQLVHFPNNGAVLQIPRVLK